jgi:hypothetical protein
MPRHIGRQQIVRKRGRHSTPCDYAMTRHRLSAIGQPHRFSSTTVGAGAKGAHRCGATVPVNVRNDRLFLNCWYDYGLRYQGRDIGNRNSLREIAEDREFYELQQP